VGKTTLVRTLLGQDVGEVRDGPHITQTAQAHRLLTTPQGDELSLWDTPGFGDSVRLHRRLSQAGQPLGWFLTQVWDRWTDPAFFLSQQAMQAARDQADIVLYLVNATESPEDCGYLRPELDILTWLGKPVVVLLNQLGQPGAPHTAERDEQARWATHLTGHTVVKAVLPLDAFARCWVHEEALLTTLAPWLDSAAQPGFSRLVAQWRLRNVERFERSVSALATELLSAATDIQTGDGRAHQAAQKQLAQRVLQCRQHLTRELLALHGLQGQADHPLWRRLDTPALRINTPLSPTRMGLLGAITSGAATGLGADALAGGLTLGAGALVGAVLGALTFAGAAVGANKLRQQQVTTLALSHQALTALLEEALLKYLAVAHFGRGRGDFVHEDSPAEWHTRCTTALTEHAEATNALWTAAQDWATTQLRQTQGHAAHAPWPESVLQGLQDLIASLLLSVLQQLYPQTDVMALRTAHQP
jgi:hypothetical protein